jgi:hypothetical protein
MTTTAKYPSGQQLISSALTQNAIDKLMQSLTCGMLGIVPDNPFMVRLDWPEEGQPFQDIEADICYLKCTTHHNPYSQVRDRQLTQSTSGSPPVKILTENWLYTRAWEIAWTFYGPNCIDRARMVNTAVLFVDYFSDQLALQNLFPVPDAPEPTRMKEERNAQWWDRADFHVEMYEQIAETINDGIVTSVEVKVYDKDGEQADVTISS